MTKRSEITDPTKRLLWGLSAGYCQFEGCTARLTKDGATLVEYPLGQAAHIVGAGSGKKSPRSNPDLSDEFRRSIDNAMLLCHPHHQLVDKIKPDDYPPERLIEMKKKQEERIRLACSLPPDYKSYAILYGANIGNHSTALTAQNAFDAMRANGHYPAMSPPFEIQTKDDVRNENDEYYWALETQNLRKKFGSRIQPELATGDDPHVSVFALAPQPLLVLLGTLLTDKCRVAVFQRHRLPEPSWSWPDVPDCRTSLNVELDRPNRISSDAALVISLSASISEERLRGIIPDAASIWHIRIPEPSQHCIKTPQDLKAVQEAFRRALNEIGSAHGNIASVHVFPAMPISAAVNLGLVYQEKADPPLVLYDQIAKRGFVRAFNI